MDVISSDLQNLHLVVLMLKHLDIHEFDEVSELVDVEELEAPIVLHIGLFFKVSVVDVKWTLLLRRGAVCPE